MIIKIKVEALNIMSKNEDDITVILENFSKMINSLPVNIQIISTSKSKRFKDSSYVTKEFFIVINEKDKQTIENTINIIKRYSKNCKLTIKSEEVLDDKLIDPQKLKPTYVVRDNKYYTTFYVEDWPINSPIGHLNDIYNNDLNVDVVTFIKPQDKTSSINYLNRRLVQHASNNIIMQEDGDIEADKTDDIIYSAYKMREEMYQNKGKFFFISTYIRLCSDSLNELKQNSKYLNSLFSALSIKIKPLHFKHDDGFNTTEPLGIDFLQKNYNFTSSSAKLLFPFISSNIMDEEGVLVGSNLANSNLVFLDMFNYDSALMILLGKTGSGKSFFTKALSNKLNIQIDIYDRDGEYKILKDINPNIKVHNYKTYIEYEQHLKKYVEEMDTRDTRNPRMLIIDEGWLFLDESDTFAKLIKYITLNGRKKYQGLIFITQMIDDLLTDGRGLSLIDMASIKVLMKMEPSGATKVKDILSLTKSDVDFIISADNEGILIAGSKQVQFKTLATDDELKMFNTNPHKKY